MDHTYSYHTYTSNKQSLIHVRVRDSSPKTRAEERGDQLSDRN